MFRIKIVQVGKMKRGPLQTLGDELQKRLRAYAKVEVVTVKKLSIEQFERKEVTILLSEHGKTTDSMAFAESLRSWSDHGQRTLTFLVAGPFGFDPELREHADHVLSLSPMTFPHELAYVILLEQLYRAGTILAGKTYHY